MSAGKKCGICRMVALFAGIGALNWGLVGAFEFDLVSRLLGFMTAATRGVYTVIGIAGLGLVVSLFVQCPCCKKESC